MDICRAPATNTNVNLTSSSATLLFVRVPGEASDALRLKDFGAFTPDASGDNGNFGSLYIGSAPKYLAYRLGNTGNVAEQPTGSAVVKNVFGKQVRQFQDANPNKNTVLIDQTRRIDLCLNEQKISRTDPASGRNIEELKCNDSKLKPGRYTARLALVYGDSNSGSLSHDLGAVSTFWYLPLWFIAAVIITLLILTAVISRLVRNMRGGRSNGSGAPSRRR